MTLKNMIDEHDVMDIMYGHDEEFLRISKSIVDTSRWSIHYEIVVQHVSSGTYYVIKYSQGATEHQDEGPENIEYYEAEPVQVITTQYRRKQNVKS